MIGRKGLEPAMEAGRGLEPLSSAWCQRRVLTRTLPAVSGDGQSPLVVLRRLRVRGRSPEPLLSRFRLAAVV